MPPEPADGPEALAGQNVSRETIRRLEVFVALLRKWQPAENLIAPSTLPHIWQRHVADSAQLVDLFPSALRWADIGSGAGFPGIVLACCLADTPGAHVDLIESNQRKCAFLRRAVAETGAPASVHQGRAEAELGRLSGHVDAITARAVAALSVLLDLSAPIITAGATGIFPKGRDFEGEVAEASQVWDFDLIRHRSRINEGGVILEISRAVRKDGQPGGQVR